MISFEASVAQICVLYGLIWSWMIFYEASVAQICVLLRFNDRQWSRTKPRSPKYVSYLDSMIENDLLQSLSRSNMCLIKIQWSSMISYKALVAQICFYLIAMIVNDLLQSLARPNMCLI